VLQDGSTALVITPGYRLKFNLNEILEGGDDAKENARKKLQKRPRELLNTKETIKKICGLIIMFHMVVGQMDERVY
jgi:hypothetical protein